MVNLRNIETGLKAAILILLVIFLVLLNILPKSDCDLCEFKDNEEVIRFNEFLDRYFEKCIDFKNIGSLNDLKFLNQSFPT